MSLIDDLGLDPDNFDWQDLASCRGMDTNWFYDTYENDEVAATAADQICYNCPVITACGLQALEAKEEGLWGGVYWTSSGKPDKSRNKHKTEEEWKWLEQKLGRKLPH